MLISIEAIQQSLLGATLELCQTLQLTPTEAEKFTKTVRHLWFSYLKARLIAFDKNANPINNTHRDKIMYQAIKNDGFTGIPGTTYDPEKYKRESRNIGMAYIIDSFLYITQLFFT